MKPILSIVLLLLWPLVQVRRLLSLQLRLRRKGRRWRFVLDPSRRESAHHTPGRSAARSKPRSKRSAKPAAHAPANDMHTELHALLAQHGKTRGLMRHLAYIERSLKLMGADALESLPLGVLKKGCAQLEELVSDWSSPGLAELRLRLSMLAADKEEAAREFKPSSDGLSVFLTPQRLEVAEASASDFDDVQKLWNPTLPPKTQGSDTSGG
jgi:hypothetical protein